MSIYSTRLILSAQRYGRVHFCSGRVAPLTLTVPKSSRAVRCISGQALASVVLASLSSGVTIATCDGGNEEDIFSRVRKMMGGEEAVGLNGQIDALAKQVGSKVADAVETGVPTQLSYGFVCGYCSGYALKKVGKGAAVVLGLGFMTLQTLNYSGYIQVDHEKLKKDVEGLMDLNNDGKIDEKDLAEASDKIMEVMSFGLPSGCGFAAGFWGGLRSG
uniref:EF-hand domain-containing protein n=1 Tax=Odontella aurita TaxID=265563 RepID=A0A7S4JYV9_9STRA|mmetsp:Transcript_57561/g.171645  ORF Transcript_57561/g.171645 Transcript_57561/m.171645 type:complete len:217 (+) Transcript_57561:221-871(+)